MSTRALLSGDCVGRYRVMKDLMESGFELIFHSHVILQSFDSRVRALKPEFCEFPLFAPMVIVEAVLTQLYCIEISHTLTFEHPSSSQSFERFDTLV